jgi:hypothetical protein
MKLFYFLLFVSSIAFGQVNREKIVDITWYPTSQEGTEIVYSSVKRQKKNNYYIKLKSDQTYIVPNIQRRRCPTGEKPFLEGTWNLEYIDGVSFLYFTQSNRTTTYKILYANQGMLQLELIK